MRKPVAPTVVTGIDVLYTLQGLAAQGGRHPTEASLSPISKAALVMKGSRIIWLGAEKNLPRFRGARRLRLPGCIVTPAFTECHTHLLYDGCREDEFDRRVRGESYADIARKGGGIRGTARVTRAASDRKLLQLLSERLIRLHRQGVAVVEIKTGYGETPEDELRYLRLLQKCGRRSNVEIVPTLLAAHWCPDGFTRENWVKEMVNSILPQAESEGLCRRMDAFVDEGAYTLKQAQELVNVARALGWSFCLHADQLNRTGAGVWAAQNDALSADHLVQLSAVDVAKFARSNTVAVLLPTADLYTRIPYPPARALLDQGARVALSTDHNPGSSPSLDVRLVGILARAEMGMSWCEVLSAWTYGAAAALGRSDRCGSLVEGMDANFIAWSEHPSRYFYDETERIIMGLAVRGKYIDFV